MKEILREANALITEMNALEKFNDDIFIAFYEKEDAMQESLLAAEKAGKLSAEADRGILVSHNQGTAVNIDDDRKLAAVHRFPKYCLFRGSSYWNCFSYTCWNEGGICRKSMYFCSIFPGTGGSSGGRWRNPLRGEDANCVEPSRVMRLR